MPEHLTELLHDSVDELAIPRPDARGIAARGRALRTRRRVGAVLVAAAVVAAVGVGTAVVAGIGDGDPDSRVAHQDRTAPDPAAYDEWGAWIAGDRVTVGEASVHLPGAYFVAQTSVGAVVQVAEDDAWSWVLVDPAGEQTPLSIPSDVVHVEGDPSQPRVVWLEPGDGELTAHIWDVATDRELIATGQPSAGTRADDPGADIRVPVLDGDSVYWTADDGVSWHVVWRGDRAIRAEEHPFLGVRRGTAIVQDGERWLLWDVAAARALGPLDQRFSNPRLSPDGRYLLASDYTGDAPSVWVVPVAGGTPTRLPGLSGLAAWTLDGHVIGQVDGAPTLRRCSVTGACDDRPVAGLTDEAPTLLVADYLMVG
ncbi:hypothetical protein F9L07_14065 [Pimelobacter simplex]|uniref:WD40 repeat domain-containing protein n=1 Tax=Nocardioides simplex TaxID=2045 RepID=A0A7J5E448_NOCSI|nr:hypothetical protein [Pimelobacter simplex]KAB2812847.1 hypothetical protein F9L07_14065 [Pimelobacter simplex]